MYLSGFRKELEKIVSGRIIPNAPLSKYTSLKVGGPAEILFIPSSIEDLVKGVMVASRLDVPVTVLGSGTNVLVADSGIPGMTVKPAEIREIKVEDNIISAGAGVHLPELSRTAKNHGLSGLEFAVGIPASLGGAVFGNAGAHGSCLGDVVRSVRATDKKGKVISFYSKELGFGYRSSIFKGTDWIILEAVIELEKKPIEEIQKRMDYFLEIRRKTQPEGCATAGSVFVNPPSGPAGYYIEKAGLKGLKEGGAQVSTKHANFFVNTGNATADDFRRLIKRVQDEVFSMFNIRLKTEIDFLGGEP